MHETSLKQTLCDYLTGEEIEETTYEDCRQALSRMLVEERGYPREQLRPKVGVNFPIDGKNYCRVVDLVAYGDDGRPLLVLFFTAGQPGTFDREIVAAARLIEGGPAPLAVATDTTQAVLHETAKGKLVGSGLDEAIPRWDHLLQLAAEHLAPVLDEARRERERRILFTYSEFIYGSCCFTCPPKPSKV
ncbi:MAG: type I restriction enzyme HsdR N-terminal domain-containing protein [Proteobacteria bacterium]|nr:type I restriction enzyme HsdR N-terminal domain-containing protein [Pseudomonadota bacterium]